MHPINWAIVGVYVVYVVWDGLRRAKNTHEIEGYLLAGRSLPWWVVGLSVMATQLSAITLIGTTGQGATDGMRFVQFSFGLPLAMVILGVTLVPFLHGAKVFTAYEYLERRFDAKTRPLPGFPFLLSRGRCRGWWRWWSPCSPRCRSPPTTPCGSPGPRGGCGCSTSRST